MHKGTAIFAACVVVAGVAAYAFVQQRSPQRVDPKDLTPEQKRYCENVTQWNLEEMLDVPPNRRVGRPDSRGTYSAWCLDLD